MAEQPGTLIKAKFQEVDLTTKELGSHQVTVQFNPETMSLTYNTQKSGGDQRGGAAIQYAGPGATKLTMELWFDVTRIEDLDEKYKNVSDVRSVTRDVLYFMKPQEKEEGDDKQFVPPGVKVSWGDFALEGLMDSLSEKLEYFSEKGRPLRAMLSIGITSQAIELPADETPAAAGGDKIGTKALHETKSGENLPQLSGDAYKEVAMAHELESLLSLPPNMFLDLSKRLN